MARSHVQALVRRLENHGWRGVEFKANPVQVPLQRLQGAYAPSVERSLREHANAICDALRGEAAHVLHCLCHVDAKKANFVDAPKDTHVVLQFSG